jgi:hypothetical protein
VTDNLIPIAGKNARECEASDRCTGNEVIEGRPGACKAGKR